MIQRITASRLPTSNLLLLRKTFKINRWYYRHEVIFVKYFLPSLVAYVFMFIVYTCVSKELLLLRRESFFFDI
jgi:hypothetical protein